MKILITGASGLLGQYLNISLSEEHEIACLYHKNIGNCNQFRSIKIDLNNNESLKKIFNEFNPEVVILTAAISSPTLTNKISPKEVYHLNVRSTKYISELCDLSNAKLIYTSTDLVYAGYRGSMLKEDSKLIPISLYAESKLMGEVMIQNTFDNFIIFRTALLYGFGLNHSKNHFHHMYQSLKNQKEVKLFIDQYRTPLSLIEAARIIRYFVNKDVKSEIINLGGNERVSRFELGERLCEIAKFDKSLLIKSTMDDVPELPKVEDVSLDTDKLKSYGIKQKSITESIEEILKNNYC
jgi:dTDP-4-dehydrorhamnose reductase